MSRSFAAANTSIHQSGKINTVNARYSGTETKPSNSFSLGNTATSSMKQQTKASLAAIAATKAKKAKPGISNELHELKALIDDFDFSIFSNEMLS